MSNNGLQKLNRQQKLSAWSAQIAACRSSDLSVSEWCKENGVKPSTYYKWQKTVYELTEKGRQAQFAEICVPVNSQSHVATLHINGIELDIMSGIDSETLKTVCTVLKEC